jgi:uncharacterized protein YjiS (DUF1127 family)
MLSSRWLPPTRLFWISRTANTSRMRAAPSAGRTVAAAISALTGLAGLFLWRVRCRRELSALTPEQMRDAGLDPEAVRRESRKLFWQA